MKFLIFDLRFSIEGTVGRFRLPIANQKSKIKNS